MAKVISSKNVNAVVFKGFFQIFNSNIPKYLR